MRQIDMTGLGVTTVSRALNDAPDIGRATKERVRLVANQIGYRPNRAGVRLRTGKTNVISLVLSVENEILGLTSHVVYGISEYLAATPYHLIVTPYRLAGDPLDREVGDLIGTRGAVSPKLFTYMRYNAELTERGLSDLGLADITPEHVQKLDSVEHIAKLQRVGQAVAKLKISQEHFHGFP